MDGMEGLVSDEIQAVLRGGRNGIMYGLKIRFPHALVMTFLFADGRYTTFFCILFLIPFTLEGFVFCVLCFVSNVV